MPGSRGVWGPLLICFLIRPRRGRSGGHCACWPFFVVSFQAFREPNALPFKLIDMAMMGESIQPSRRQRSLSEDLGPFGKSQIEGHQQGGPFIAVGKHLKQQLGTLLRARNGAQLVANQ